MKKSPHTAARAAAALVAFCWMTGVGLLPGTAAVSVRKDAVSGQVVVTESGRPVLQYNYQTIQPGDRLERINQANQVYARARSDYIHPLYGPDGAVLTQDWPLDHPHHRGIYWAWPEVQYGQETGDLHALQRVFARPTGRLLVRETNSWAEIEAENEWLWEDKEAVVREQTLIRVHAAGGEGRAVDLAFRFVALKEGITLARRGKDQYGGLNIRLEKPANQQITTFTDPPAASPRMAWSDVTGSFGSGKVAAGLAVLQHAGNPDYPGDWIQYPELGWCQPSFPAAKTRYRLDPQKPLTLRYRLWVHDGGKVEPEKARRLWTAYTSDKGRLPRFQLD
jgi:hypothetical protein